MMHGAALLRVAKFRRAQDYGDSALNIAVARVEMN